MNDIGFISKDMALAIKGYDVSAMPMLGIWDRQTIVLMCDDKQMISHIRNILNKRRRPNSVCKSQCYMADGFVNLDYNINERDPANRNVRIVYCDMGSMRLDEVYNRFCNSYIIKVERSESIDGTLRISREIPKISG